MWIFIFLCSCIFQRSLGQEQKSEYPKLTGYFGIVHPLVSLDKETTKANFTDSYTVGFPTGLNILKNDHIGFSFEVVPFIKAQHQESKVDRFLFHPGVIFRRKNGFSFTGRIAFETTGCYGFTPVFTKVIKRNKDSSFYLSAVASARFGNSMLASITLGLQIGIAF